MCYVQIGISQEREPNEILDTNVLHVHVTSLKHLCLSQERGKMQNNGRRVLEEWTRMHNLERERNVTRIIIFLYLYTILLYIPDIGPTGQYGFRVLWRAPAPKPWTRA